MLYTIDELLEATSGSLVGETIEGVNDISIDTRTLKTGEAYFAIKGEVHDGHKFVGDAVDAKAALCVVEHEKFEELKKNKGSFLVVENVLIALEKLAEFSRARSKAQIVAITGSVGKTTTKEMLKLALGENSHASQASYNNHWGVPLSLAKMPKQTNYGVFEIGMNHSGEITPLVKLVKPDVVLLNNVAPVHLAAFNSVEEIAYAKSEIFHGLSSGGSAVLDKDNEWFDLLHSLALKKNGVRIMTFGKSHESDSHLISVRDENSQSYIKINLDGRDYEIVTDALGEHMAKNISAVLAVLHSLKVDIEPCLPRLESMQPVKGRGQRHKLKKAGETFTLIDESYNANPLSMKSAINLLGNTPTTGNRIAVLGDMLELGKDADKFHAELQSCLQKNKIDKIFLVGEHMAALHKELNGAAIHTQDIRSLTDEIITTIAKDDIIMAKASFGMQFSHLIESLLRDYSN